MIRYNYIHSSIRTTIERAFGLLKGRFRRLKYLDQENVETMTNTIAAACCLHNICIMQEDIDEYFEQNVGVPVPVAVLPPGISTMMPVSAVLLNETELYIHWLDKLP